jgi:hypothetical protein
VPETSFREDSLIIKNIVKSSNPTEINQMSSTELENLLDYISEYHIQNHFEDKFNLEERKGKEPKIPKNYCLCCTLKLLCLERSDAGQVRASRIFDTSN